MISHSPIIAAPFLSRSGSTSSLLLRLADEKDAADELDPCWRITGRRGPNRSEAMSLYDFLSSAQLEHYYSVLSKHHKIRSVDQLKYLEEADLVEIRMSKPEQRRLWKYFERECPQTAIGKLRKKFTLSSQTRSTSMEGRQTFTPAPDNGFVSAENSCRLIPHSELEIASILGQGEFGRVHQGFWRPSFGTPMQVAIKILDVGKFPAKLDEFTKEASLMHLLNHPDIVQFYGVSVTGDSLKMVTELAPLRSLLECLREPDLRSSLPVSTLHNYALQISRGMAFLEEERLVHRDLAARNVLVFSRDKVKIGDFGLSRALQLGRSHYQANLSANLRLALAWTAPEAIHDLRFTSASDVWSFGVTLWEIFSYGFTPWAGLSGAQILEAIDPPRRQRLQQPDTCPEPVYEAVMRACWNYQPEERPSFKQLTEMLPHLSPQSWFAIQDYSPCDLVDDCMPATTISEVSDSTLSHSPAHKPLIALKAEEVVFVLRKRDPIFWKVVSRASGRVGFVPSSLLRISPQEVDSILRPSGGVASIAQQAKSRLRFSRRDISLRIHKNTRSSGLQSTPVRLRAELISLPRNDFRHVGHVGADGSMFGSLGFSFDTLAGSSADHSPTHSCTTLERTSSNDKSRLSDVTILEMYQPTLASAESRTMVGGDDLKYSEQENKISAEDSSSLFEMGTSFMDEVFRCFSLSSDLQPEECTRERQPLDQTPTTRDAPAASPKPASPLNCPVIAEHNHTFKANPDSRQRPSWSPSEGEILAVPDDATLAETGAKRKTSNPLSRLFFSASSRSSSSSRRTSVSDPRTPSLLARGAKAQSLTSSGPTGYTSVIGNKSRPEISAPVFLSGPYVEDRSSRRDIISVSNGGDESYSDSLSQGSSLTVISSPSIHSQARSRQFEVALTTPSISPAPSLASMTSYLTSASAGFTTTSNKLTPNSTVGLRALRDKDAIFRAKMPISRRLLFNRINDGTYDTLPQPLTCEMISLDAHKVDQCRRNNQLSEVASSKSLAFSNCIGDDAVEAGQGVAFTTNEDLNFWGSDFMSVLEAPASNLENECLSVVHNHSSQMKPLLKPRVLQKTRDDEEVIAL